DRVARRRERLGRLLVDDQHRAAVGGHPTDGGEGADRVGQVVDDLAGDGQVVAAVEGRLADVPDLDAHPVGDAAVGGVLAGQRHRRVVEVERVDGHVRVRLGQVDPEPALAAADVDDA